MRVLILLLLSLFGASASAQTSANLVSASGFARLLPRLLDLEQPSNFPVRQAFFTHVEDRIARNVHFDRNKIRIARSYACQRVPISIRRLLGIRKYAFAGSALRAISANSLSRQPRSRVLLSATTTSCPIK